MCSVRAGSSSQVSSPAGSALPGPSPPPSGSGGRGGAGGCTSSSGTDRQGPPHARQAPPGTLRTPGWSGQVRTAVPRASTSNSGGRAKGSPSSGPLSSAGLRGAGIPACRGVVGAIPRPRAPVRKARASAGPRRRSMRAGKGRRSLSAPRTRAVSSCSVRPASRRRSRARVRAARSARGSLRAASGTCRSRECPCGGWTCGGCAGEGCAGRGCVCGGRRPYVLGRAGSGPPAVSGLLRTESGRSSEER